MSVFRDRIDSMFANNDKVEGTISILNENPELVNLTDMSRYLTNRMDFLNESAKAKWGTDEWDQITTEKYLIQIARATVNTVRLVGPLPLVSKADRSYAAGVVTHLQLGYDSRTEIDDENIENYKATKAIYEKTLGV